MVIVKLGIELLDSEGGTSGKGAAISVYIAEGVRRDALRTQRKPQLHLGHFQEDIPNSLCSLACFSSATAFRLVFVPTDDTDVMILAGIGSALASIPLVTDLDVWIVGVRMRFFGGRSQGSSCCHADSNDDVVCDEVTKSVEFIEGQVVGMGNAQTDRTVKVDDSVVL